MRTKRSSRPGCLARGTRTRGGPTRKSAKDESGEAGGGARRDRSRSLLTRMDKCSLAYPTGGAATNRSRSVGAKVAADSSEQAGCSRDVRRMASGLIESCREHFGTSDLYAALGVAKSASPSEVKKAYHKLSLKVHPDRAHGGDINVSTNQFQTLGCIYSVLSDKERRAVYDETGDVGDESSLPENADWAEYWRLLFGKVTLKNISDFETTYRGSTAEVDDLKEAYMEAKGNMGKIIDTMLCATESDEERFRTILDKLISEEAVPKFNSYGGANSRKRAQRQKWAADEATLAEQEAKRLGLSSDDGDRSLLELLNRNRKSREERMESLLSSLAAKHSAATEDDGGDALDVSARRRRQRTSTGSHSTAAAAAADGVASTSAKAKRSSGKGGRKGSA